jgi:4-amino-4-deoxy-L-arabinose transferase-like glycosyltransferase
MAHCYTLLHLLPEASAQTARIYPWLAFIAAAIMLLRVAVSIPKFSPTIDEPAHIGAAVSMLEAHKLIAPGSHPPLARLVAAIPLWLDGARLPQCRGQTAIGTEDLGYDLGTRVLAQGPKPYSTLLTHTRLAMLIFPCIALLYVYLFGDWISGPAVAVMAVIFLTFDPTFLGQAFWIGNDMAGCAGYLAAVYHGLRWTKNTSWKFASIAGIALGLAISAKFSCLLAIPTILILALINRPNLRRFAAQSILVAFIAFLVLWATYFFNIGSLSDQAGLTGTAGNAASAAMRQQWQRVPHFIQVAIIPMPSFFLALARLALHNRFGHGAFLNGQVSAHGWWYYFPEILALKSTLSFLAALLLAAVVAIIRPQKSTWLILIPAFVFLAAAMVGHLDIGIRYILPALPFLYLFIAQKIARPRWAWVLAILMLGSAAEGAIVHPDYLSYFNLAAGGPTNGQRFALDSNVDWNQDVYRMARWINSNSAGRPYAIRLNGSRNAWLLSRLGLDPNSVTAPAHGHLLFISKNVRLIDGDLPWLSHHTPIATIGHSIDVYDLTSDPSASRSSSEPEDNPTPDPTVLW